MASNKSKGVAIFRVVSGNFLEMYDFMVYGFYATAIAKTFFPGDNPFASLMLSLATFGAGFLMRPLGAVFLGAYIDRHGRRQGLIITLGLMAMGTLLIAFVPGYATLGVAAPLLVLFGRLLQGFSAGVELGGVSVYLSEIATPGRKGFFVSWQSASQQVAVVFAGLLGVELWLSFLYSSYNGAMVVALTEVMPADVRTTGFSLAYSLATATFGGFTPAVCTWLIHTLDNRAAPGIWLSGAALLGLLATLVLFRRRGKEIAEAELANA